MRSVGQRFPPLPPRAHSPPPSWGFARQPNHGGDPVVERRAIAKPSRLQFTIATPALRHERSPPFTSNLFQRPRHDDEMIPGTLRRHGAGFRFWDGDVSQLWRLGQNTLSSQRSNGSLRPLSACLASPLLLALGQVRSRSRWRRGVVGWDDVFSHIDRQ